THTHTHTLPCTHRTTHTHILISPCSALSCNLTLASQSELQALRPSPSSLSPPPGASSTRATSARTVGPERTRSAWRSSPSAKSVGPIQPGKTLTFQYLHRTPRPLHAQT